MSGVYEQAGAPAALTRAAAVDSMRGFDKLEADPARPPLDGHVSVDVPNCDSVARPAQDTNWWDVDPGKRRGP
jgi:hypothetical protein